MNNINILSQIDLQNWDFNIDEITWDINYIENNNIKLIKTELQYKNKNTTYTTDKNKKEIYQFSKDYNILYYENLFNIDKKKTSLDFNKNIILYSELQNNIYKNTFYEYDSIGNIDKVYFNFSNNIDSLPENKYLGKIYLKKINNCIEIINKHNVLIEKHCIDTLIDTIEYFSKNYLNIKNKETHKLIIKKNDIINEIIIKNNKNKLSYSIEYHQDNIFRIIVFDSINNRKSEMKFIYNDEELRAIIIKADDKLEIKKFNYIKH